jgi:hypothetical protein
MEIDVVRNKVNKNIYFINFLFACENRLIKVIFIHFYTHVRNDNQTKENHIFVQF